MSVRVVGYVDEELMARLSARAQVEGRTLSNMVERLLSLGLGTVVTEREQAAGPSTARAEGERITGIVPSSQSPRSVTTCPNAHFHRSGSFCKSCGQVPA